MEEKYRYTDCLVPIGRNKALSIGSAVHKGLETGCIDDAVKMILDIQPDTQEEMDEIETAAATVSALLEGYQTHMEPLILTNREFLFTMPLRNPITMRCLPRYKICGKIDGIAKDENGNDWIVEYKTASVIDSGYVKRISVDDQINLYTYAAQRHGCEPVGVIYRVIRKPGLRRRKGEDLTAYRARIIKDIEDRPDWYFYEEKVYKSKDDIKDFEERLFRMIPQYAKNKRSGFVPKHTKSCNMYHECPYLPICSGIAGWEALYEKKEPNEELLEIGGI